MIATDTQTAAVLDDIRTTLADAVSDPRCAAPAVLFEKAEEAARYLIDPGEGYWIEVRYHIRYHRAGVGTDETSPGYGPALDGSARSILGGDDRGSLQVERGFSGIPKLFFKASGERDIRSHPSGMAEVTKIEIDSFSVRAWQSTHD